MNDLISRQAAIEALRNHRILPLGDHPAYNRAMVDSEKIIRNLPAAQAQGMRGMWKRTYLDHEAMGERPSILYCSKCSQCIAYPTNYCPNCGADMREGQDETD